MFRIFYRKNWTEEDSWENRGICLTVTLRANQAWGCLPQNLVVRSCGHGKEPSSYSKFGQFVWCCVYRASYRNVLMSNEMHNSYNKFLFHSLLSALRVSNESSRSSSGARHNILYYTVQSVQSVQSCRRLACTILRHWVDNVYLF